MKRSERQHLKQNDFATAVLEARQKLTQQRSTGIALAVVAGVALLVGGYWAWHTRNENLSQAMLTDALVIIESPVQTPTPNAEGKIVQQQGSYPTITARAEAALAKFQQVANRYPGTSAGVAARYYSASALAMLGRPAEAETQYQQVVDRVGPKNFYGRMSQLGVIESDVQAKKFDAAIAKAQALANANDDSIPRDAALMELGRAYAAAGKKTEAKQTFDKVVAEFPESAYADEAKMLATTS